MSQRTENLLVGWLVVFNVPSTARSSSDGTRIYCPLRRTLGSLHTKCCIYAEPWYLIIRWYDGLQAVFYGSHGAEIRPNSQCQNQSSFSQFKRIFPNHTIVVYLTLLLKLCENKIFMIR